MGILHKASYVTSNKIQNNDMFMATFARILRYCGVHAEWDPQEHCIWNGFSIAWFHSLMKMIGHPLVISSFFVLDDFHEMAPTYLPADNDWELLEEVKAALDCLSAEKTLTLCDAIPAFEAIFGKWEALHQEYPHIRSFQNCYIHWNGQA
ncbi:hypothetical protein BT96DRAFT_949385 [Gymnopus androsaceus JB14]|uniref:Uncharacterized protein n=1 Tax=Gymnopus androsaceus JB14 TaxID=1447944 RepID=A0A6A4GKA4_9AGAR|nr:hypothetical protein BT96DRAFT_949385 [Gymnopus androsaceus JB14]